MQHYKEPELQRNIIRSQTPIAGMWTKIYGVMYWTTLLYYILCWTAACPGCSDPSREIEWRPRHRLS